MTTPPSVTRKAVDSAFVVGDLETIEAYFAQPHVRHEVMATDAAIVETAASDPITWHQPDGSVPWFRWPILTHLGGTRPVVPLVLAARHGHAHVVAWLFAQAQADLMAATLALLLRPVALVDDTRKGYVLKRTNGAHVLEALLSSYTFQHVLSHEAQEQLLDDLVSFSAAAACVRVAIAHGACVDQSQVLEAVAFYGLKETNTHQKETTVLDVLVDAEAPTCSTSRPGTRSNAPVLGS